MAMLIKRATLRPRHIIADGVRLAILHFSAQGGPGELIHLHHAGRRSIIELSARYGATCRLNIRAVVAIELLKLGRSDFWHTTSNARLSSTFAWKFFVHGGIRKHLVTFQVKQEAGSENLQPLKDLRGGDLGTRFSKEPSTVVADVLGKAAARGGRKRAEKLD
ncbi:hypothetical protein B0H19DRAFT_1083641 [Mycena capillaripes]|nr:hypothetical protein B0H19DRAFT_1083641 [Mycena capillaripes]